MNSKIVTILLLTLCIILAALIMLPYQDESVPDDLKPINNIQKMASISQPKSSSIGDYSEFTTRPLFSPKRSPYVKQMTKQTPQVIKTPAIVAPEISIPLPSLIGVLTVNNIEMAFVLGEGDVEPVSLKIGDSYKKWTLSAIEASQIKMTYNEREEVINLDWTKMNMLNNYIGSSNVTSNDNIQDLNIINGSESAGLMNLKDRLARQLQNNK